MRDYTAEKAREFKAQVQATNEANALANKFHPILRAAMEPFLGQKVEKVDGPLLEKVKKCLPELPGTVQASAYRHSSNYSLAWTFKSCVVAQHDNHGIANYHEVTVYVGDLSNGVLTMLHNVCTDRKTDYDPATIEAKRAKVKELKQAYEDARSELYPFGE